MVPFHLKSSCAKGAEENLSQTVEVEEGGGGAPGEGGTPPSLVVSHSTTPPGGGGYHHAMAKTIGGRDLRSSKAITPARRRRVMKGASTGEKGSPDAWGTPCRIPGAQCHEALVGRGHLLLNLREGQCSVVGPDGSSH